MKPQLANNVEHDAKHIPKLDRKNQEEAKKKTPVIKHVNKDEWKWNFSFRFWNQIKYFGLDRTNPSWFISLFEKLKTLSKENRKNILEDGSFKKAYRYHKINWNQKNIPIQRKNLTWIDKDYLDNPEEFEMFQFQISQSLGRIVGFWDENTIFNVVLLDPLHNIQPSKDYGYRVDDCNVLKCDYSSLLYDIKKCETLDEVKSFPTHLNETNVLMHFIDEETHTAIQTLIDKGLIEKVEDIIDYGIYTVQNLET